MYRMVDPKGVIHAFAGTGAKGFSGDGGPAVAGNGHEGDDGDAALVIDASMSQALGIATDDAGNVYFSDYDGSSVRKIDANGIITTVAGGQGPGFHGDCSQAIAAKLSAPNGLAVHDGVLYTADSGNNRIRMVVP